MLQEVVNSMNITEIVSQNQDVLHGALVFAGTRVPVASLLDHLKAGDTLEDFLTGFPSVSRQQAEAFLEFAFQTASSRVAHARAA